MGEDRDDDAKPTLPKQGTVVMQAVIRPATADGARSCDERDEPISSTIAMPAVPDPNPPGTGPTKMSPLPMTECAACKTLTPVARFCSECGAPLVARRFCSECGAHLTPGAKFCEGCGTKVP